MQIPFKVNPCVMVRPCVCSVSLGTSQNEIETTPKVEWRGQWCGEVSALQEWHNWVQTLAAWDHNLHGRSTTVLISVTLLTYTWPFSYNSLPLCLSSFALPTQLHTLYQQPSELWMVSVLFPVSPPPASGGQLPGKWGEGGSAGVRREGGDWNDFPADLTALRSFAMKM